MLFHKRCLSVTHDRKGEVNEFDQLIEDEPDPITDRCNDWHPDLVWYEPVDGDVYQRGLSPEKETVRNNKVIDALLYTRALVKIEDKTETKGKK